MDNILPLHRPLFLFSTGRSGTTLLMRYLNCSDNCVVWGEHNGFITPLAQAFSRLNSDFTQNNISACAWALDQIMARKAITVNEGAWSIEWANPPLHEGIIVAYFQKLLTSLLAKDVPPSMRWGFKEISYGENEYLFLKKIFPSANFLFLVRNPFSVIESKVSVFAKGDWGKLREFLRQGQLFLDSTLKIAMNDSSNISLLMYDDLATQPRESLSYIASKTGLTFSNSSQIELIISETKKGSVRTSNTPEVGVSEAKRMATTASRVDLLPDLEKLWLTYFEILKLSSFASGALVRD